MTDDGCFPGQWTLTIDRAEARVTFRPVGWTGPKVSAGEYQAEGQGAHVQPESAPDRCDADDAVVGLRGGVDACALGRARRCRTVGVVVDLPNNPSPRARGSRVVTLRVASITRPIPTCVGLNGSFS